MHETMRNLVVIICTIFALTSGAFADTKSECKFTKYHTNYDVNTAKLWIPENQTHVMRGDIISYSPYDVETNTQYDLESVFLN